MPWSSDKIEIKPICSRLGSRDTFCHKKNSNYSCSDFSHLKDPMGLVSDVVYLDFIEEINR